MQRSLAVCLTFGVLGLAYCCYAQDQGDTSAPAEISALQRKRIGLLQERISNLESFVNISAIDQAALIRPRMDLINARLDYAGTNVEKRRLLTDLIGEYDKLIQMAELALDAPISPSTLDRRSTLPKASSELLWLKSERIRIQVSRDILK